MKRESQVCSLLQAKKLKELGLTAKSYFGWCVFCPDPIGERYYYEIISSDAEDDGVQGEYIAHAYNVSELGAMLSDWLDSEETEKEYLHEASVKYGNGDGIASASTFFNPLFLADVLIHCLTVGLITADHCNNILSTN